MAESLYRPKVFISHSAKDGPPRAVLARLQAALAQKFEVLLDERVLAPGDEWRAVIDDWVVMCDAAIILLSEDALDSQYVNYEATLLRARWKARKDSFLLIPIRFPEVTPEMLEAKMGPLQLGEIQHLFILNRCTEEEVAAAAAERVVELLGPLPTRFEERHDFEVSLTKLLHYQANDEGLEEIGDKIPISRLASGARRDKAVALARALFELNAGRGEGRFSMLVRVAGTMRDVIGNDGIVRRVINIVTPFCWVDPIAAVQLPLIAVAEGRPRLVAWRRSWMLSELMYLHRIYCGRGFKLAQATDKWSGYQEEDIEHVRRCLSLEVRRKPNATVEEINSGVANWEKSGSPTFLVVPAKGMKQPFFESLLAKWPRVTFIFQGEELDPAEVKSWGGERVLFLEPRLAPDVEADALMWWGELMALTGVDSDSITCGRAFSV